MSKVFALEEPWAKIIYSNEQSNGWIYEFTGIAIAVICIRHAFCGKELQTQWAIIGIIICTALIIAGKLIDRKAANARRHREEIVKLGMKHMGRIVDVVERKGLSRRKHVETNCYLQAVYADADGGEKEVFSSCLSIFPGDCISHRCIIYTYNGDSVIDYVQGAES